MNLPYHPADPPEEPPPGCDRLTWTLAYQVHRDHRPAPDGQCLATTCRATATSWPCDPSRLAAAGFVGSVGWWAGVNSDRPPTRWPANLLPPRPAGG
ncbi:MAG: hypothetical protein AUI14_14760 [Actinobacteria bacterium 13_2_20CM_2_71_6]|nr:MAG: hypothetical protein AUI14_14760 [Actinobacteria bacterium 13_2_20CM_2_71_6]